MTRRVWSAVACAIALALATAPLAAQESAGKLQGTVTDQANVPIANAQVFVVGTSFGAVTNDKGYYFINNVPVGTYTIRAQFIGYAPAELRGIRVQGGQTVTGDVKMQSSAVVLTGVTVTAAANPIVPRDQVASKAIVSGELVNDLPVDDVRSVVALQPGVVESGSNMGVSIRGGRPGEANVYIDGAPVRQSQSGAQGITIGTNALEEASVTTGALPVEFSDAQSGVINFTTKSGGQQLAGSASYETDEPFGDAISVGYNRIEASLGGPIPGVNNFTWFASTVLQGQQSRFRSKGFEEVPFYVTGGVDQVVTDETGASYSLPQFVQFSGQCGATGSDASDLAKAIKNNYGFECQGRRRAMDWESVNQFQAKLQYSYGTGSNIALTGLATGDQRRTSPGRSINVPGLYTAAHDWGRLAVVNWVHQVTRSAERALSFNVNLSYGVDHTLAGPLQTDNELDTREATMGMYFGTLKFAGINANGFPNPINDDIIRNVRTNTGLRVPLLDEPLENAQANRANPYGMETGSWFTAGFNNAGTVLQESRWNVRAVADWQANRYHRFTLGGDYKKTNLEYWAANSMIRQSFMDAYVVHPDLAGLFASDRLDLGDVVLELGIRYDYYHAHTLFPTTPGFTFTIDPSAANAAATDDAAYQAWLADRTIWSPSTGHSALSPRLRVSFPVTEQTGFRLSYSHQVQTPDFATLASGINSDLSFTNTNDTFGRDVDFGKSILFEFGVKHAFSNDVVLDISAYNKDKVSDLAYRILPFVNPRVPSETTSVNVLTNLDFGNARGVDMKFDWRAGNYFNAQVAYTFQVAKGTGSDPTTYLNTFARQVSGLTGDRTLPPEQAQRTDADRTHNIGATVSLSLPADWRKGTTVGTILQNFSAFASLRVLSGLPYTRLVNAGDGQVVGFGNPLAFGLGGRADEGLNNSVMPWNKFLDLRLNKGFRFGRLDLTAYADIRNLLNWQNVTGLFAETGDVVNAKHRHDFLTSEYDALFKDATDAGVIVAGTTDNSAKLASQVAAIDLTKSCDNWGKPVDCESLRRVEARFGDGDGIYSVTEQQRALNTFYNSFFGSTRFHGEPRHVRLGVEVNF